MTQDEHDETVRRSFREQVGQFSRPDSPFASRNDAAVAWVGPLTPAFQVLDVACGAAHVTEAVAPYVRQVVGVDLTRELLDVGAQRLREAGLDNVLLQEAHAAHLPFVDESFDLVVCRSALHHMADPHAAVKEMVRVCRMGGRIAISDLVAPHHAPRDTFDHLHRLLDPSHVRCFVDDELDTVWPRHVHATSGHTSAFRLPIDIAITPLSDRSAVVAALRAELDGGAPTGFDPSEDGTLEVAFVTRVVHATRAG